MSRFNFFIIVFFLVLGLVGFWISTDVGRGTPPAALITTAPILPSVTFIDPQLGNQNASTTIIEFADFTCPFCRDADIILRNLVAAHPQTVHLIWKDFPNDLENPLATTISYGGRCAQKFGKFEMFRNWAFNNQDTITRDSLATYLKSLGVNDTCLDDPSIKAKVDKIKTEGLNLQIDGTPYLLINNARYTGTITQEALSQLLNY